MEEHKLFNEIKSAAESAESRDFPGMESVWNRVEQKLDKKEDKKAIWRWKKIAVAASLLLFATLGYQFFKSSPNEIKSNETVTVTDSIHKATTPNNDIVVAEPKTEIQSKAITNPDIKQDAAAILQKQISPAGKLALEEVAKPQENAVMSSNPAAAADYFSAPVVTKTENDADEKESAKYKKSEGRDVELFMNKESKKAFTKKEEPLVIMDNKVVKEKLENIEFSAADSLVVLNDPLYIINGVEFTEQQVFGPNPSSPYTPLNKQEIETISILQHEKAIEIYGAKGKKGVVIITTRKKQPAANVSASKKAK